MLLIGGDESMSYLLARYAESIGLSVTPATSIRMAQFSGRKPCAIWFSSLEAFVGAGPVADIGRTDVPLLVCSATGDEERARELGADYFLVHPLTYRDFVAALDALGITQLSATADSPR
jgi:hypothetical protein